MLDVAAGNGNTALAGSRRGGIVTALDPSQAQIEQGRQRARMESSPIAWVRADGRRLPFADSSFDGCLDSFGEEMVSAWNAEDDGSVLLKLRYQLTVATKPRT